MLERSSNLANLSYPEIQAIFQRKRSELEHQLVHVQVADQVHPCGQHQVEDRQPFLSENEDEENSNSDSFYKQLEVSCILNQTFLMHERKVN